jgi:hypothetical protein
MIVKSTNVRGAIKKMISHLKMMKIYDIIKITGVEVHNPRKNEFNTLPTPEKRKYTV